MAVTELRRASGLVRSTDREKQKEYRTLRGTDQDRPVSQRQSLILSQRL